MKHCYIVLTQTFAAQHEGAQQGCNVLKTATTLEGKRVVSLNAVNEFPEIFQTLTTMPRLWLGPEDFPQPEPPFPAQ